MSRIAKTLEINFRFQDETGQEFLVTYHNPRNAFIHQASEADCVSSPTGRMLLYPSPTMLQCRLDFEAWTDANGEIFTVTKLNDEEPFESEERDEDNEELEEFLDDFTIMQKG